MGLWNSEFVTEIPQIGAKFEANCSYLRYDRAVGVRGRRPGRIDLRGETFMNLEINPVWHVACLGTMITE
jgi:hypothetical protein